jgi:hypothetical protein
MDSTSTPPSHNRRVARIVFFVFTLTFIASRALVICIMLRWIPDLFLHLGGTHVHHLNYGIFLLSAVGAVLLFSHPTERQRVWLACAYGFGMALTFDEFGMWLHLGGSYWQRASYDAVVLVAALMGLIAFAPRRQQVGVRHVMALGVTVAALVLFSWLSLTALDYFDTRMGGELRHIEEEGPQ